uniref:Methyltransferase like 17 n=1 Tax=Podarcis muralis TaxID=64176 RepID=A0A670JL43_PODMU
PATLRNIRTRLLSCRSFIFILPGYEHVSQVDNSSDFLGKIPHRQHPGILHLKNVRLPSELVEVAQFLVTESSMRNLEQQTKALTNYLWSRKRPLEAADLRRKAHELEQKFREKKTEAKLQKKVLDALRKSTYHWEELKYTEELSFIYMAARMDGVFAAVTRAFHEIQKRVSDFEPRTLLDFGSGTGAVTWAAHGIWGKSINEYMNIDSSASMLALAERLMKGESCEWCYVENFEPYHASGIHPPPRP